MIRLIALTALLVAFAFPGTVVAQTFTGPITYVVDGDTFDFSDGTRIRVWGVQAPEQWTLPGKEAKAFVKGLIYGKVLDCTDKRGRSWGRYVARCFLDGEDFADILVDAGYATDWPEYSGGHYAR